MKIPGLTKKKVEEPVVLTLTPLQHLLAAENEVSLAQGRIDEVNKEIWEFKRHYQVIEDPLGQYVGVMNEAALSEKCTELQVTQQFNQFTVRKNELLREFHQKLASWAQLKEKTSQSVQHVIAVPTLPPA